MERERPVRAAAQAYTNRNYNAQAQAERDPYADIPFWMPTTRWERKWVAPSTTNTMPVVGQKPSSHRAMVYKWIAVPGKKPENFEEDEVDEEVVEEEERRRLEAPKEDVPVAVESEKPEPSPIAATAEEKDAEKQEDEPDTASISAQVHAAFPPNIRTGLLQPGNGNLNSHLPHLSQVVTALVEDGDAMETDEAKVEPVTEPVVEPAKPIEETKMDVDN
ncbi:hypothetical protein BC829DRAFT_405050 [Chytridium lagenaria]|nr:hypothetical protein BC829DRAFT_405050 [Chytridium lagenaria]